MKIQMLLGTAMALVLGISATASAQTYGAPCNRPVVGGYGAGGYTAAPVYGGGYAAGGYSTGYGGGVTAQVGWGRPVAPSYYPPVTQVAPQPYVQPIVQQPYAVAAPYGARPGYVWVEGYWQPSATGSVWIAAHWQPSQQYTNVVAPCPTRPAYYGARRWW